MLPPELVLADMAAAGLGATELGPAGYLGQDAAAVRNLLDRFGLRLVGGFVPIVLHDLCARDETVRTVTRTAELLAGAGASVFVSAVVVDEQRSSRVPLDAAGWRKVVEGLDLIDDICAAHHLTHALHPHFGTLVETADDIQHLLHTSGVRWCLDTGHLALGGVDPVAFAAANADRIAHVHLKDVRLAMAPALHRSELTLLEATRSGLFCPLGQGQVPVGEVVAHLEGAGYDGWYVMEQDTAIDADAPKARAGAQTQPGVHGPKDDVQQSIRYLRALDPFPRSAQRRPPGGSSRSVWGIRTRTHGGSQQADRGDLGCWWGSGATWECRFG